MNRLFLENSISDILNNFKRRQFSPESLIDASLSNIRELDPKYFAWVRHRHGGVSELSIKQSFENCSSQAGLLENIPVGVKDILNTVDFPTEMGSPIWKDFNPGNDARVVFNIKRQGAVVIGKTVTAEFAVHTLGKTLNPYDITKTPGTSSSGSAVAVTLGMVPFATGTQTAGSIVRPASFCGVYGCKPSFGTIPRTGSLKTTDSLDTAGFFVIHQSDLRRGFDSMRIVGKDYPISNSALSDKGRQCKPAGRPWRVGFVKTHTWKYAPQYARDAVEGFVKKLALIRDIKVIEAILPVAMEQTHIVHEIIYNKALAYYFKKEYQNPRFVSPVMKQLIDYGEHVNIEDYKNALSLQMELIYEMDHLFDQYDILVSLSTAGEAPLREVTELPDPALMWTMTHLPVVSVPKFTSPNGMPFGIQVVARKYNDYLLFSFLDYLTSIEVIPVKAGYFVPSR